MEHQIISVGYFELARNVSKYSNHKYQIGCVLINHKPLSVGFNKTKTHTKYANPETSIRKAVHAEVIAILNSGKESIRNGTAYIYRETKDGNPALARPCKDCMERLENFGIKRIFYTTEEYPYYREERI